MQLLHLDSSILGEASVSRALSAAIVARLLAGDPSIDVTYHDLVDRPLKHMTMSLLGAVRGGDDDVSSVDAEVRNDLNASGAALDEFMGADIVVIGVAFYNFTIASQLKAWVDRIIVAGRTFRYGPNGLEGLAAGKRVVLAIARGGLYAPGTDTASAEHAESYLRAAFAYIGITSPEVIVAEGLKVSPEHKQRAVAAAERQIAGLA